METIRIDKWLADLFVRLSVREKPPAQPRAPLPKVDRQTVDELRLLVAQMREELTDSLRPGGKPIDAADMLNRTGDSALKHRCYLEEIEDQKRNG